MKQALDILAPTAVAPKEGAATAFSPESASKWLAANGWTKGKASGKVKALFTQTIAGQTATALVFPSHVTLDIPDGEFDQVTSVDKLTSSVAALVKQLQDSTPV